MAGTVRVISDMIYKDNRELVIGCIGDASDGTIPDTDLCALSGYTFGSIQGWGIWFVETLFGATAPTDNSDLLVKSAYGGDLLGGAGINAIKAAANAVIWPLIPVVPIGKSCIVSVDGQEVHDAIYTLVFHLVR